MTKGQLLALDTPQKIKKQFGVGYKILIEPLANATTQEEFVQILTDDIKPLMSTFKD